MIDKQQLIDDLEKSVSGFKPEEREEIMRACHYADKHHAGQKRYSGDEFVTHPISVATILAGMNVEKNMILAGLLHDVVEDTGITLEELCAEFSDDVGNLVNGVTKITLLKTASRREKNAETIRKILLAMIKDVRVIIIKFADKLHNLSTLSHMPPDKRKRIAKETIEIYAPLAGKMGMNVVKDQFEDYALRWINPDAYKIMTQYLARTEKDRERTLSLMQRNLSDKLSSDNIPFFIKSRTKHLYSIYKKMKKYNKQVEEIFDRFGIRVITDTVANCYQIFGLVHSLWQPVPGRFKDYIAHPKSNGYKSLHTTVIVEKRKAVEIQIRTEEMDEVNEYGVAAHWYYKKSGKPDELNFTWLQQLRAVHDEEMDFKEYYRTIRDDILKDQIYVFTPFGDIMEMPKGSTAIDFAYRIHTMVGHRCKGAKANGIIIPLNKPLGNGMHIEIITGKEPNPKQSWLSIVVTSHARKKIKSWFASQKPEESSLQKVNEKEDARKEALKEKQKKQQEDSKFEIISKVTNLDKITVEVDGERNILYSFAQCCNPVPPSPIIGFISRGRGLIIHRENCRQLKHIRDYEMRKLNAQWVLGAKSNIYSFNIKAQGDSNPFVEIGKVITKYRGEIIDGKLDEMRHGEDRIDGNFTAEFGKKPNIEALTKEIRRIPSVLDVKRQR
jgi:guanosine-3',5'-bis(diphosphate) 3'-pyrophosphohydrolase